MSLKAKIEAVIYAADEPVTLAQLAAIFGDEVLAENSVALPFENPETDLAEESGVPQVSSLRPGSQYGDEPALLREDAEAKRFARLREREACAAIEKIVNELIAEYTGGERGMEIREIASGYRIATKAEYHDAVRAFVKSLKPQMKLSLQALETLAVVAYKQPVTAPEISEIRGVDTSGVLGGLMARKLITTAGRKQVIGRPILYKTTKEFLLRFGLKDIGELPSMEEFEKMAVDMGADMEDESSGASAEAENAPDAMTPENSEENSPEQNSENSASEKFSDT